MSIIQTKLVWGLKLPHNQFEVLMALADAAHDDGSRCFPSVGLVAWMTDYSDRQVRRLLASLRTDGLIEAVAFDHGGTRPTEYQLHLDRGVQKPPRRPTMSGLPNDDAPHDTTVSSPPGTAMAKAPDTVMADEPSLTVNQPSGEPSVHSETDTAWLRTLRSVDGWDAKGEPHIDSLMAWVNEKGWTISQLEAAAIGLADMADTTLKGKRDLSRTFQRRLNEGYDRVPVDGRGPSGDQGQATSGRADGWNSDPA